MYFRYSEWDEERHGDVRNAFERLFELFQQLLQHTAGDAAEALRWLTQLDKQYGLNIAGHNPVAAMPSLHFAGALLVSVAAWRWDWTGRLPSVVYTGLMGFALVYLGEHYVADLVIAALVVAVSWRLARRYAP